VPPGFARLAALQGHAGDLSYRGAAPVSFRNDDVVDAFVVTHGGVVEIARPRRHYGLIPDHAGVARKHDLADEDKIEVNRPVDRHADLGLGVVDIHASQEVGLASGVQQVDIERQPGVPERGGLMDYRVDKKILRQVVRVRFDGTAGEEGRDQQQDETAADIVEQRWHGHPPIGQFKDTLQGRGSPGSRRMPSL
jgi:hypothetical protein